MSCEVREKMVNIKIRKKTPAEIEPDTERWSQLGKEFAAICEGKDTDLVFFAALLFFSNVYAMTFGEPRRTRVIRMLHAQLSLDANETAQDEAREHWRICTDCRPNFPCKGYLKLVERVADAADARTLRVNSDGSFELSAQGCPHEA
jgi:hypothetical protein